MRRCEKAGMLEKPMSATREARREFPVAAASETVELMEPLFSVWVPTNLYPRLFFITVSKLDLDVDHSKVFFIAAVLRSDDLDITDSAVALVMLSAMIEKFFYVFFVDVICRHEGPIVIKIFSG